MSESKFSLSKLFTDSRKWISEVLNNTDMSLQKKNLPSLLFAGIGFLGLIPVFKAIANGIWSLKKKQSRGTILDRYLGSNTDLDSWVLITGATDGIGLAWAHEFASLGFNLILVSRDKEKLENVKKEFERIYPTNTRHAQIKLIQIDFSEKFSKKDIEEIIISQVRGLDISILVNNVGIGGSFPAHEVNFKTIAKLINVNITQSIYLTQGLLPQLTKRVSEYAYPTHYAAIINYSSCLGNEFTFPYLSLYSSTKAFNDQFSKILAKEYRNLNVLTVRPGEVKTKMTRGRGNISPEDHVKSVIRFLGSKSETHGSAKHDLGARFFPGLMSFGRKHLRNALQRNYEEYYQQEILKDNF